MLYGSIGALGYLFFLESLVFPLPWFGLMIWESWSGLVWLDDLGLACPWGCLVGIIDLSGTDALG